MVNVTNINTNNSTNGARQSTGNTTIYNGEQSSARNRVLEHRASLFQGQQRRRTSTTSRGGRRRGASNTSPTTVRSRSWTVNLFCLSNKYSITVPNSLESYRRLVWVLKNYNFIWVMMKSPSFQKSKTLFQSSMIAV